MQDGPPSWSKVFKSTLKIIYLVVVPKPAFTFPASYPTDPIPSYRTGMRYTSRGSPSTPKTDISFSIFDRSQDAIYGPANSTPRKAYLERRMQNGEKCCCICHCIENASVNSRLDRRALVNASSPSPSPRKIKLDAKGSRRSMRGSESRKRSDREPPSEQGGDFSLSTMSTKSLRRSKRIAAGSITSGGHNRTTNELAEISVHSHSPSPKKLQHQIHPHRSQTSSNSFSSQSRYFELELSPIIEYPTVAIPLAPSAVISGEGEGMLAYSSSTDASPRSISSYGDVFLTPEQTVQHEEDSKHRSEAGDSITITSVHPRNLVTEDPIIKGNEYPGIDRGTPRRGEDILSVIPAVILTAPTPDLSRSPSPDILQRKRQVETMDGENDPQGRQWVYGGGSHVTSVSRPNGLGIGIDNVGLDPFAASCGGGEGLFIHTNRGHSQPLASRVKKILFRRGVDRGRRAWVAFFRFLSGSHRDFGFAPGSGPVDVSNSSSANERRRGLDLSFASTTSRWFGSPRQGSSNRVRRMFRSN